MTSLFQLQKYLAKAVCFAISFAKESMRQSIAVMKIGYARVSTGDQHLELQLEALQQAGCKRIFREKVSGAGGRRPEFLRMLDQLREGDTVVVWKLSSSKFTPLANAVGPVWSRRLRHGDPVDNTKGEHGQVGQP
jgi:hypothetical protein